VENVLKQRAQAAQSVILLKQNQTLASAFTPLRCDVRGLVRKLFEKDGFRWVGDVRGNCFPRLKPLLHWCPIQPHATVGHDELHRARSHNFSDKALVTVPDTLAE